ncbi:MAG: CDP-alcohol phosphatidyltransferase family protein [Fermentimonas sp.]|jgi:CDP-diacylglycerol--serine O-phosphatidyltransferase
MKKQLPNIITLLNLFSGTVAITLAFQNDFKGVVIWVIIAAIFDFFDGFTARLLKSFSEIGKDLDSLADVVSFGVAPACALFVLMKGYITEYEYAYTIYNYLPYIAFLIPAFSAYRLAMFNHDERQTINFIGLPTPANGMFWVSACYVLKFKPIDGQYIIYILTGMVLVMSILMVSNLNMLSFKIKNLSFRDNFWRILLAVVSVIFIIVWGIGGIAVSVASYIIISLIALPQVKRDTVK